MLAAPHKTIFRHTSVTLPPLKSVVIALSWRQQFILITKQVNTSSCSIVLPSGMMIWLPVNPVGLIPGYAYNLAFRDVAEKASTVKSAHSERCSLRTRTSTAGGTFCQGRTKTYSLNRISKFSLSFHSRWTISKSRHWNSHDKQSKLKATVTQVSNLFS